MANIDEVITDRFGVNYLDAAERAITEIDIRVFQVAKVIDLVHAEAGENTYDADYIQSLALSTIALLGVVGPHIDVLTKYVRDTRGVLKDGPDAAFPRTAAKQTGEAQ